MGCKKLYAVLKVLISTFNGLVAQLVRAPPCHGGGRGFESLLGRYWDLSSAGRASALQAEGHRFEPCRSHFCFSNNRVHVIAFFILKFAFLYKYAIMK